jgi:hypothetical protein
MLRRPSALCAIRREEGCSSTAVATSRWIDTAVWNNPGNRGSAVSIHRDVAAVP